MLEVYQMDRFQWASTECNKIGITLTKDIWEDREEILVNLIIDQDIDGLQKEIAARQAVIRAVERFGTILSLPLVEYASQPPPNDLELYQSRVMDITYELSPHDGFDALHPLEYFDKYDCIWRLIAKEQISIERIRSALDELLSPGCPR